MSAEVAEDARAAWRARLGGETEVLVTSSATGAGLDALAAQLLRAVPEAPAAGAPTAPNAATAAGDGTGSRVVTGPGARTVAGHELAEHRVFRPTAPRRYAVRRVDDATFSVTGEGIERLLARYDLDNEEALAHLERRLKGIGVLRALEAEGFRAGDEVQIAGVAFDLDPEV